jgi:hypothetical protein
MRRNLSLLSVGIVAGLCAFALPAEAESGRSLDRTAVFPTLVPHSHSLLSGPSAAPGTATPATSAVFGGTPYTVGSTVTATTTLPEGEEHIAIDPDNPANLVAAISDFALRGGYNTTKYAFSTDNGADWAESYVGLDASEFPLTSDGLSWEANSDPVLANDTSGSVYLSDLYFNGSDDANGLYVSVATRAADGSVNFNAAATYPVVTNPVPFPNFLEDKPWIAVDNSSNPTTTGSLYASWSHFTGFLGFYFTDTIVLSRSTDHGQTWSTPIRISPPAQDGAVQGSQVAVGPNGEVYVVYELFYTGSSRQQFLAKSTNGGVTFASPVAITPVFNELSFASTYRKNSFAALAVSPVNGNVYVAYADQRKKVGAEVELIRSTNGGASFTAPVVVNDRSAGQQFMPALTVDSSDVIHVSWFDTRNSPSNSSLYDIFATRSLNDGATFSPNARVTAGLVNAGTASFIGDYAGIAAAGGSAHPVWTSGGFNNGQLQTARLQ